MREQDPPIPLGPFLLVANTAPGVRLVRLLEADPLRLMPTRGPPDTSRALRDLNTCVVDHLAPGDTLVLNLRSLPVCCAGFYTCLLHLRRAVLERGARLVLCELSPGVREVILLFQGDRLFPIRATEQEALHLP